MSYYSIFNSDCSLFLMWFECLNAYYLVDFSGLNLFLIVYYPVMIIGIDLMFFCQETCGFVYDYSG